MRVIALVSLTLALAAFSMPITGSPNAGDVTGTVSGLVDKAKAAAGSVTSANPAGGAGAVTSALGAGNTVKPGTVATRNVANPGSTAEGVTAAVAPQIGNAAGAAKGTVSDASKVVSTKATAPGVGSRGVSAVGSTANGAAGKVTGEVGTATGAAKGEVKDASKVASTKVTTPGTVGARDTTNAASTLGGTVGEVTGQLGKAPGAVAGQANGSGALGSVTGAAKGAGSSAGSA
jgi:hypothetical protein